jgi:hypothetical protein
MRFELIAVPNNLCVEVIVFLGVFFAGAKGAKVEYGGSYGGQ